MSAKSDDIVNQGGRDGMQDPRKQESLLPQCERPQHRLLLGDQGVHSLTS
jgi:hypothetical protein